MGMNFTWPGSWKSCAFNGVSGLSLSYFSPDKGGFTRTQIGKIRKENGDISTNLTEIKRIIN